MSCAICRHDLSGFNTSVLECGHTFHSDCLITLFRCPREWGHSARGYGTCPLCRAAPLGCNYNQYYTTAGRVAIIKKLARENKHLHPQIQRAAQRLADSKKKHTEDGKILSHFKKENKNIISQFLKLRSNKRKSRRKIWKMEGALAAFDPLAMLDNPNAFVDVV